MEKRELEKPGGREFMMDVIFSDRSILRDLLDFSIVK